MNTTNAIPTGPTERNGHRILVVYFSRSGHTDALAHQIARGCHADIERIEYRDHRQGLIGHARAAMAGFFGVRTAIGRGLKDPGLYHLVIVGTPVWFWGVPGPMKAWLRRHHGALVNVAVFCTSGSLGGTKALDDLELLSGRHACARLVLPAHAVERCRQEPAFQRFLQELKRVRPVASNADPVRSSA